MYIAEITQPGFPKKYVRGFDREDLYRNIESMLSERTFGEIGITIHIRYSGGIGGTHCS